DLLEGRPLSLGEVGLLVLPVDDGEVDPVGSGPEVVDDAGAPALPPPHLRPTDLPKAPGAGDDGAGLRVLDEVSLEAAVRLVAEEVLEPPCEGGEFDEDHGYVIDAGSNMHR